MHCYQKLKTFITMYIQLCTKQYKTQVNCMCIIINGNCSVSSFRDDDVDISYRMSTINVSNPIYVLSHNKNSSMYRLVDSW